LVKAKIVPTKEERRATYVKTDKTDSKETVKIILKFSRSDQSPKFQGNSGVLEKQFVNLQHHGTKKLLSNQT